MIGTTQTARRLGKVNRSVSDQWVSNTVRFVVPSASPSCFCPLVTTWLQKPCLMYELTQHPSEEGCLELPQKPSAVSCREKNRSGAHPTLLTAKAFFFFLRWNWGSGAGDEVATVSTVCKKGGQNGWWLELLRKAEMSHSKPVPGWRFSYSKACSALMVNSEFLKVKARISSLHPTHRLHTDLSCPSGGWHPATSCFSRPDSGEAPLFLHEHSLDLCWMLDSSPGQHLWGTLGFRRGSGRVQASVRAAVRLVPGKCGASCMQVW